MKVGVQALYASLLLAILVAFLSYVPIGTTLYRLLGSSGDGGFENGTFILSCVGLWRDGGIDMRTYIFIIESDVNPCSRSCLSGWLGLAGFLGVLLHSDETKNNLNLYFF